MSYIRSTSNPESLYIWGDDKRIHVCHRVERPLSSAMEIPTGFDIPAKTFDGVLARWHHRERVSFRGCTVEEVYIYTKTGRPVPRRSPMTQLKSKASTEFLIRLAYKENFVYLWRVTWEHVVGVYRDREEVRT